MNSSGKRIVSNTLMLYTRMLFSVVISLYTSRVVLNILGVEDYGIYALVGGITSMLSFINASMGASSSRYLSYELGQSENKNIKNVFSTSIIIHVFIAIVFLLFAETLGLWYVKYKIIVPEESRISAIWVYQSSVVCAILSIIQSPYHAFIIAKEQMSIYAYVEILNVSLKLVIVYLLLIVPFNKLICYGLLLMSVSIFIAFLYIYYSRFKFNECRFVIPQNKRYFRPMLSFSLWNLLGDIGYTIRQNGSNIVLNLFYGPVVNAANGIAMTVQGTVMGFSTNVVTAIRPPLIKQYSKGEMASVSSLLASGTKLSLLLMFIISGPIFINTNEVLKLWLGEVPEYCISFTSISLMCGCVSCASQVLYIGLQAANKIKIMNILRFVIYASSIFILWGLLKFGFQPDCAYYLIFIMLIVTTVLNLFLLRPILYEIKIFNILCDCIKVVVLAVICIYFIEYIFENNSGVIKLILSSIGYLTLFLLLNYFVSLNKNEREKVNTVYYKLRQIFNYW